MQVIIIGGSAAGLKAACRISRLQPDASVKVLVKDKTFAYSACGLTYYLAGDVDQYSALFSTPNGTVKDERYFCEVKGVEVLAQHEVVSIDRVSRIVHCRDLAGNTDKTFPYDKLVIATGTVPLPPSIPGIETPGVSYFTCLEDAIKLRADLERNKIERAAIIGGGYIGLELCEAFSSLWGVEVELIELQPHVLIGMIDSEIARLVESELLEQGIKLSLGCKCQEIFEEENKLCIFNNAGEMIPADRIIVASGLKPNSTIAVKSGIEIGVTGGIKVNDRMQTSDPDIFAAGDCVELANAIDGKSGFWPLGSLASRMGRVVGDNVCNGNTKFGSIVGAAVLKLFDLTIGTVGLTSAQCRENGYETRECWGTFHDRLFYYPDAVPLHVKVIFDKSNGQILGVQVVSKGQLLHVIDKASQVIQSGWTIDRLVELEHAYAPPYTQPFDPLHSMAFIADNSRSAGVDLISPLDFDTMPVDTVILDVRSPHEIETRQLETSDRRLVTIPVEELRSRIGEVPKNARIITVCQMGGRGWDAALILRRAGWSDVGILGGGALFLPVKKVD